MKYLLILPLFIASCMHYEAAYVKTYNSQCVDSFNQMKPPIILSNIIDYGDGLDGVILRDGYDINHTFGGLSTFANWLANEYAIGDTVSNLIGRSDP
jgi:hypothetical protein